MNDTERFNICIGGTFSPLHKGHEILFRETFKLARKVHIGLTSDRMAMRSRDRDVMAYHQRSIRLREMLDDLKKEFGVDYSLREIHDRFGFAVREEIDAIVVSKETESTVNDIDRERTGRGLPPLRRFVIDMVLDDTGERISSTRIQKGEIDRNGRSIYGSSEKVSHHVCVHLASKSPEKVSASINAFKKYWPGVQVFKYDIERGQGSPGVDDPLEGAVRRVEDLKKKLGSDQMTDRDHLVGIEAGSIKIGRTWFLVHFCHISNKGGEGFGSSSGLEIPSFMMERIMAYRGSTWEIKDVSGTRTSLIDNLSGGSMSRDDQIEQAVEMALLSFSNSLKNEGCDI